MLPNVKLALRWNDTKGDTVLATKAITEMICDGISVIFGPEGHCYVEAIVSQSRNIPMISYVCYSNNIHYNIVYVLFYSYVSILCNLLLIIILCRNVRRIEHQIYVLLPALNHLIHRYSITDKRISFSSQEFI